MELWSTFNFYESAFYFECALKTGFVYLSNVVLFGVCVCVCVCVFCVCVCVCVCLCVCVCVCVFV